MSYYLPYNETDMIGDYRTTVKGQDWNAYDE